MGAIATINDNRILTGATRLILPSTLGTSIEFLHILTSGVPFALQNFAVDSSGNAKANATLSGAPVSNTGYLSLHSGVDYLTTSLTEPVAGTLISVCRQVGADGGTQASRPNFIGSYSGGGGNTGVSMYPNSGTQLAATMLTNNGTSNQSPAAVINDTMNIWASRIVSFDNTSIKLTNQTSGVTATANPTGGYTRATSSKKILIGSGIGNAFNGYSDVMLAIGWSRVLSDNEKADAYTFLKKFSAIVGIVI